MGNGVISEDVLMKNLMNSKRVMNKVDNGNYERGNIDENVLSSDPMDLVNNPNLSVNPSKNLTIQAEASIDKINNSKLPDNIKRVMIEKPIERPDEISLNETFDIKLVEKAKNLMAQDGTISNKNQNKQNLNYQQNINTKYNSSNDSINESLLQLIPMIENTIRKVLDEKLTQILTAQDTKSLNEGLVIKVGDSVFKGKITGFKSSK